MGRSSWPRDHPYVPLVPGVPLMTPAESRAGENRCGVRMFKEGKGQDPPQKITPYGAEGFGAAPEAPSRCPPQFAADFLEPAVGQKWDRVRLTCSQPFSRQGQFGLSFLRLRTPSDPQPDPQPVLVGAVGVGGVPGGSRQPPRCRLVLQEDAHSPQRCSPAICRMLCAQTGSWVARAGTDWDGLGWTGMDWEPGLGWTGSMDWGGLG